MPWNDNANPGPWGSPSGDDDRRDPQPKRPERGPSRPPEGSDLNAGLDRLRRRLRGSLGGGPGGGLQPRAIALGVGAIVALWALSGLYVVQPEEEAVVTTFGAYSRTSGPGLRYHLPIPIERAEKVTVTSLKRTDIGGTTESDVPQESLMLTGDENIINLDFSVTWRVADARRYLFATRDPNEALKAVAESAMREVVGKTPLQQIFTSGRGQVQLQVAELMQRTLDSWGAGVQVVEVQIRSANPPQEVVPAFREVNNAEHDADSAVNEANAYRNRVINEAKGDAAKIVQSAQGYREQAVREALGEAARFDQVYAEYRRAPAVTRERLYLETMERVLSRSNKVIVGTKNATAPIVLPPDALRRPAPRPAPQPEGDRQDLQRREARAMTRRHLWGLGFILFVAAVILGNTFFIVDQRESAIVVRFGEPVRVIHALGHGDGAGLNMKTPFLERVIKFDRRNLALEADQEEVISADQNRLVVDAFLRYRISDPLQYYRTLRDDRTAAARLEPLVNSSLRQVLGSTTSSDIISRNRAGLMQQTKLDVARRAQASRFGIQVIDLRIKRADLPAQNQAAVYRRMQTSRQQEAAQKRAVGEQQKREIIAGADKEVAITLATAQEEGETTRGQGDAQRTRIFAQAYGKDPSFAAFWRSMQAYERALAQGDTAMVLSPDSDFFRYFQKGAGR